MYSTDYVCWCSDLYSVRSPFYTHSILPLNPWIPRPHKTSNTPGSISNDKGSDETCQYTHLFNQMIQYTCNSHSSYVKYDYTQLKAWLYWSVVKPNWSPLLSERSVTLSFFFISSVKNKVVRINCLFHYFLSITSFSIMHEQTDLLKSCYTQFVLSA